MINKKLWLILVLIFFSAGAWYFYFSKDTVEANKGGTGKEYSAAGINSIMVNNQTGNVKIQQWNKDSIKIETKVRKSSGKVTKGKAAYKVHQKGKEFEISADSGKDLSYEFKITVPKSLKKVDVRLVQGNAYANVAELDFLRMTAHIGNVIGHFQRLNTSGSYILMTDMGNVFVRMPKDSKIKLTGDAILDSVQKGSVGPRFTVSVKDIPWNQPIFMGGQQKKQENNEVLSVAQMNGILNNVIDLFSTVHPYVKNNPSQYEKVFNDTKKLINKPMSVEEFYYILDNIFVDTKDGHTHLELPYPSTVDLPHFTWTSEGLIVTQNEGEFKKGDKIIKIGGKTQKELLSLFRTIIPAEHDGYIKYDLLSKLKKLMNLKHFGLVKRDNSVDIELERDRAVKQVNVPFRKKLSLEDQYFASKVIPPYSWKMDENHKLGVFTLKQCVPNEAYDQMLREFFTKVKEGNINDIVVDIRGNEGGSTNAANMFIRYLNTKQDTFKTINNDREPIQKAEEDLLYNGNIYVLTDYGTFSAGTDFAVIFQTNGFGKIIGQPTGNNASYGGNVETFPIKGTPFIAGLPTTKNPAPVPAEMQDKPIVPDIYLEWTRKDIEEGSDPWMEKVYQLTAGGR